MNVTPLIDILRALIIVFMVIVAATKDYKVDAPIPQPADPEQPHQNESTIVIQVVWSPQSQIPLLKINQESVPWEQLEPDLERISSDGQGRWFYIKGDESLDFESVAQVIAAHNAGISRAPLLTKGE